MVLFLLCNHWQFLLGFSAMAKQNQNKKKKTRNKKKNTTKKHNDKTQLSATTPPPGVCIFIFWVSCFFGFLFSGSLLVFVQWLSKTKKPKTKKNNKQNFDWTRNGGNYHPSHSATQPLSQSGWTQPLCQSGWLVQPLWEWLSGWVAEWLSGCMEHFFGIHT